MFSRLTRLSLRRCVHTASTTSRPWSRTVKIAFGASAVTATYMTWQLTNERNYLALDSINPTKITRDSTMSPNLSLPADSSSEFSTSGTKPPDSFIPDAEQHETQDGGTSESSGGGAFNPQTGEINWDCPCLGGMAHGPCGPEFREAFSCFVFSEVEPKGIDCVEKFKAMQNCFKAHPEVYADEIMDDDDDVVVDDEPVDSENPEVLPPVVDSSEKNANDTNIPEVTSEKPHLQRAGSRDR